MSSFSFLFSFLSSLLFPLPSRLSPLSVFHGKIRSRGRNPSSCLWVPNCFFFSSIPASYTFMFHLYLSRSLSSIPDSSVSVSSTKVKSEAEGGGRGEIVPSLFLCYMLCFIYPLLSPLSPLCLLPLSFSLYRYLPQAYQKVLCSPLLR
jgi:hypothetical protein